jgi:hypothetical protein
VTASSEVGAARRQLAEALIGQRLADFGCPFVGHAIAGRIEGPATFASLTATAPRTGNDPWPRGLAVVVVSGAVALPDAPLAICRAGHVPEQRGHLSGFARVLADSNRHRDHALLACDRRAGIDIQDVATNHFRH